MIALLNDVKVKRSSARSCLHEKGCDLGTAQTPRRSGFACKSAGFEVFVGLRELRSNEAIRDISWGQKGLLPPTSSYDSVLLLWAVGKRETASSQPFFTGFGPSRRTQDAPEMGVSARQT